MHLLAQKLAVQGVHAARKLVDILPAGQIVDIIPIFLRKKSPRTSGQEKVAEGDCVPEWALLFALVPVKLV